ncbi:MAG: type IX secretion system sortase PorU [Bacteroidetes bacterium]|nr:type IX secretion system sortase PorU [Bacteroidota bacterium]
MLFVGILIISSVLPGFSQPVRQHRILKWNPVRYQETGAGDSMQVLSFKGSSTQLEVYGNLPVFQELFPLESSAEIPINVSIGNPVYQEIPGNELPGIGDLDKIPGSVAAGSSIAVQRNKQFLSVSLVPLRKNAESGIYEKLLSFDLMYEPGVNAAGTIKKSNKTYADHSVLNAGTWFKMGIPLSGIYMIQAKDLKQADPAFSSIDPRTIQIFGNNGGMLPEANATQRIDDLRELTIQVVGSDPAHLNDNDYILFYANGPDTWQYNKVEQLFHHQKNLYSNFSCCFLTYGQAVGKRVTSEPSVTDPPNTTIIRFNDFSFFEPAEINLIKSGRAWYSKDLFDITTSRDYTFNFADMELSLPVSVIATVAAHCTSSPTSFTLLANGQQLSTASIPGVGSLYTDTFAYDRVMAPTFTSSSPSIKITLNYIRPYSDGTGYLKSLELNVIRKLNLSTGQMAFRSATGASPGLISEFHMSAGSLPVAIWDVSNPAAVKSIGTTQNNNIVSFRVHTDSIREFTAFDGTAFYTVQSFTKVENQDLHSTATPDLVIVTHPAFISQANALADFHRQHDNMSVFITVPDKIYNEFSCGAQDITAIRDFMKMLYDRSGKTGPKYLLLFGDASYDYKDRVQSNTNFVPAYESGESLNPVASIVTDDYFGLMDHGEGQGAYGMLDIGVGRFPVQSVEQADAAVKKVMHYASSSDTVHNDWRNVICFVADNGDFNLHMTMADTVHIYDSSYNIDKIYLDAYDRISTPGGLRYPEVNDAITRRVEKGALVMTYVGHGGILGWAHERVLEVPQIKAWQNFDNMPVFLTATCEFSYYDDPSFTSAGELVFLNPNGGGIALLTTTRPTYSDGNQNLMTGFYLNAFVKKEGKYPTLGDLIMDSKNFSSPTGTDVNTRKFVLLGDPALQMAYPQLHVVTTSITTKKQSPLSDTLKALSTVTISGEIRDDNGIKVTGFNGTVFPTVFDKISEIVTVPNQGESAFHFYLRKNVIYKGKLAVTNGEFSFSFIVPKDIAYNYGIGKISYYARSETTDANGYDIGFVVGGYNDGAGQDTEGPEIRLFMNDTAFVSGGVTDQNPNLLAYLTDSSGINTVGNGIGHDLTATLDDDSKSLRILNDYYVSDLNTFKKGVITYPFYGLSDGYHTLAIKVWDVYNNSSDASIEFLVVSSAQLAVQHLFNYPNPFFDRTTFSFEYNQPNTELNVQIDIYSLTGQKVKTLRQPLYSNGYRANTIDWDGTGDSGARIGSGTYVYNLSLMMADGSTVRKSSKLVVIR